MLPVLVFPFQGKLQVYRACSSSSFSAAKTTPDASSTCKTPQAIKCLDSKPCSTLHLINGHCIVLKHYTFAVQKHRCSTVHYVSNMVFVAPRSITVYRTFVVQQSTSILGNRAECCVVDLVNCPASLFLHSSVLRMPAC